MMFEGTTAVVSVQLAAGGALIAGLQTDLTYPLLAPVEARSNGRPACTVNPDIDKNATSFVFRPDGCTGAECTTVRAQVLSLLNLDPIPDTSTLFTCTVAVPAAGGILDYTFSNTILSTGSGSVVLDAGDQDGTLCRAEHPPVTASATPSPSPTPTTAPPVCAGDCDGDDAVSVNEVVGLVNIALGALPATACPHGIPPVDAVDITLIVEAVRNALSSCPT